MSAVELSLTLAILALLCTLGGLMMMALLYVWMASQMRYERDMDMLYLQLELARGRT